MDAKNQTGIDEAIQLAGSQTALADLLRITPQAVQKWAAQGFVPAERCIPIEEALEQKVTRYQLNPRVFGAPPVPDVNPKKTTRANPTEQQQRETEAVGARITQKEIT